MNHHAQMRGVAAMKKCRRSYNLPFPVYKFPVLSSQKLNFPVKEYKKHKRREGGINYSRYERYEYL
jgi:hypothetical protein